MASNTLMVALMIFVALLAASAKMGLRSSASGGLQRTNVQIGNTEGDIIREILQKAYPANPGFYEGEPPVLRTDMQKLIWSEYVVLSRDTPTRFHGTDVSKAFFKVCTGPISATWSPDEDLTGDLSDSGCDGDDKDYVWVTTQDIKNYFMYSATARRHAAYGMPADAAAFMKPLSDSIGCNCLEESITTLDGMFASIIKLNPALRSESIKNFRKRFKQYFTGKLNTEGAAAKSQKTQYTKDSYNDFITDSPEGKTYLATDETVLKSIKPYGEKIPELQWHKFCRHQTNLATGFNTKSCFANGRHGGFLM